MAERNLCDPNCLPCIYYGKITCTCDYILIAGHPRPCPAGAGCTVKTTKKDVKQMGKPRWDTEQGKKMWEQGMSDSEIARHFHIAANTVLHQRRSYWEKGTAAPVKKKKEESKVKRPLEDEVLEKMEPAESAPPCGHCLRSVYH